LKKDSFSIQNIGGSLVVFGFAVLVLIAQLFPVAFFVSSPEEEEE